jgi:hypothetical protein
MYDGMVGHGKASKSESSSAEEEDDFWDESSVKVDHNQKQNILYIQVRTISCRIWPASKICELLASSSEMPRLLLFLFLDGILFHNFTETHRRPRH